MPIPLVPDTSKIETPVISKPAEQQTHTERSKTPPPPVQPTVQPTSSVQLTSQKYISSCIGAVINRKSRESDKPASSSRSSKRREEHQDAEMEDEEDMRSKRKSSTLSSVIRVSDRKYTVPKSMQPNKQILLKALNDANNSVSDRSHRSSRDSHRHHARSSADEKLDKIRLQRSSRHRDDEEREVSSDRDDLSNSYSKRIIKSKNVDNKLELFSQHYHKKMISEEEENEGSAKRLKVSSSSQNQGFGTSFMVISYYKLEQNRL